MTHTAACIISFGICTACGAAFAAFALPELPDKAQGSILLLPALLLSAWAMLMLAGGTADELAGGSKAFAALRLLVFVLLTLLTILAARTAAIGGSGYALLFCALPYGAALAAQLLHYLAAPLFKR